MSPRIRRLFSPGRLLSFGLLGVAGLALVNGYLAPPATSATPVPDAPHPATVAAAVQAATNPANPLDEPLRLLGRAQQVFRGVRDYTCTLIKQERINGQLQPMNVMTMMVRNEPFSIYLKWHQPQGQVGQEACYVAGRNGGKMRARSPGVLGAVGFVSIDPDDPRARKTSNHSITEAGLGNLLARFERRWREAAQLNKTQVRIGEYEYNKRRCIRVETTSTQHVQGGYYRGVLYFDKQTELPVRVELYDYPRQGGSPGGELVEVYSYINVRLNVGLPDEVFNK